MSKCLILTSSGVPSHQHKRFQLPMPLQKLIYSVEEYLFCAIKNYCHLLKYRDWGSLTWVSQRAANHKRHI